MDKSNKKIINNNPHVYSLNEICEIKNEYEKQLTRKNKSEKLKKFISDNNLTKEQSQIFFSRSASLKQMKEATGIKIENLVAHTSFDYISKLVGAVVQQAYRDEDLAFFRNPNSWVFKISGVEGKDVLEHLNKKHRTP